MDYLRSRAIWIEGALHPDGNSFLDRRLDCSRVKDLSAEVGHLHCLPVGDQGYGPCTGNDLRVGCHDPGGLLPEPYLICTYGRPDERGRQVRAATAQSRYDSLLVLGYESGYHGHTLQGQHPLGYQIIGLLQRPGVAVLAVRHYTSLGPRKVLGLYSHVSEDS